MRCVFPLVLCLCACVCGGVYLYKMMLHRDFKLHVNRRGFSSTLCQQRFVIKKLNWDTQYKQHFQC